MTKVSDGPTKVGVKINPDEFFDIPLNGIQIKTLLEIIDSATIKGRDADIIIELKSALYSPFLQPKVGAPINYGSDTNHSTD
jgi:hypothetical protein